VLLTGMSGTGKSTVIAELAARGYKAVDTDYGDWHEWVDAAGQPDWIWREDRIRELLATEDADVLFVSGTASNQGKFYPRFDHVVLLSAPTPVIVERLATRTNNPYGKHPDELARVLGHIETVEPLLRRRATLEVDTSVPLDQVVETILRLVRPRGRRLTPSATCARPLPGAS
jgi:dephospho-CoA kinase